MSGISPHQYVTFTDFSLLSFPNLPWGTLNVTLKTSLKCPWDNDRQNQLLERQAPQSILHTVSGALFSPMKKRFEGKAPQLKGFFGKSYLDSQLWARHIQRMLQRLILKTQMSKTDLDSSIFNSKRDFGWKKVMFWRLCKFQRCKIPFW